MRRFLLPALCLFAAGIATGYFLRWLQDPSGSGKPGLEGAGPHGQSSRGALAPAEGTLERRGSPEGGADEGPIEGSRKPGQEDNPFSGQPRNELMDILREALANGDPRSFKQAAIALGDLESAEVAQFAQMLQAADDPRVADMLARLLVRSGGKEGLEAVARIAREESLGPELRSRAIEALADLPPERRAEGVPIVADLIRAGLPGKLQFLSAHVYGRLLGPEAVSGLLDLLEGGGLRPEPLLNAVRDFARAEDLPRLTEVLARTGGREGQEMLLRAIGGASGAEGSRVLLDLLRQPPDGVRREAVGWALDEFVRPQEAAAFSLRLLREDPAADVRAAAARIIGRTGGASAAQDLQAALSNEGDPKAQEAIRAALREMGGR